MIGEESDESTEANAWACGESVDGALAALAQVVADVVDAEMLDSAYPGAE